MYPSFYYYCDPLSCRVQYTKKTLKMHLKLFENVFSHDKYFLDIHKSILNVFFF